MVDWEERLREYSISLDPRFETSTNIRDGSYNHFSPLAHFQQGLIGGPVLNYFAQERPRILSVGAGKLFLERSLVDVVGVPLENIVVADKEPFAESPFQTITMDMYRSWPAEARDFDVVLFPRSLGHFGGPEANDVNRQIGKLYAALDSALAALRPSGVIRGTGHLVGVNSVKQTYEKQGLKMTHGSLPSGGLLVLRRRN